MVISLKLESILLSCLLLALIVLVVFLIVLTIRLIGTVDRANGAIDDAVQMLDDTKGQIGSVVDGVNQLAASVKSPKNLAKSGFKAARRAIRKK